MSLRVVIMGVAGCGKSSVGEGLAARLGIPYRDGDDLHTTAAVEKMRAGIPLTDADRWPWLDRVAEVVKLLGMVNATPDFQKQPAVINGASDFLVAVLGDAGRHARSAVSAASLPLGVAVEIEAIFELK